VKPQKDYDGPHDQRKLDDIAFAQVAFSEQALAIMSSGGGGGANSADGGPNGGGGGGGGGGEGWDRRLARPENFLQLCRDDTCGKMRTLKVVGGGERFWPVGQAACGVRVLRSGEGGGLKGISSIHVSR